MCRQLRGPSWLFVYASLVCDAVVLPAEFVAYLWVGKAELEKQDWKNEKVRLYAGRRGVMARLRRDVS